MDEPLPPKKPHKSLSILIRIFLLVTLFIIELEVVEIALRAHYEGENIKSSVWAPVGDYRRLIFSFLILFFPVFLMISATRLKTHFSYFIQVASNHKWTYFLIPQLVAYLSFAYLTYILSINFQATDSLFGLTIFCWAISLIAVAVLAFLSVAPKGFWSYLFKEEKNALRIAIIINIVVSIAIPFVMNSWPSMATLTLHFSEALLQLIYQDVTSDLSVMRLGTEEFKVIISPSCSGYEGIVLVTVLLGLYLWLFRKDFRFPAALFLLPVGIVLIWIFNAIRVAVLIAIGTSFSPEVAMVGFHSNAGWIAFIIVTLGLIWLIHRIPFFTHTESKRPAGGSARMASALLVPVVILLATTLFTSAFSSGFDWLYPLKVLATGAAIWFFWRNYNFNRNSLATEPILIGVIVFIIWMLLVPASPEKTAEFTSHLAEVSPFLIWGWMFFRCIGAAITVPLAEELAFRGYLLSRLSGIDPEKGGTLSFAWFPFVLSSLVFGIFHGAWIAGTLAGMGYAIARYRRGKVGDAIIAHITTNALLSLYVLGSQEWSYW